jgi:hypothetical protein
MNIKTKLLLIIFSFSIAVIGFLVKLPISLHHIDKQLHSAFYFVAAAFVHIIFTIVKVKHHIAVIIALLFFGVGIESCQSLSNRFFSKRIHGNFDPEDIKANCTGLLIFSLLWLIYYSAFKLSKAKVKATR